MKSELYGLIMNSTINHNSLPFVVVLKHYVKSIIVYTTSVLISDSCFLFHFSNILEKQVRAGDFYHVIGRSGGFVKSFPKREISRRWRESWSLWFFTKLLRTWTISESFYFLIHFIFE